MRTLVVVFAALPLAAQTVAQLELHGVAAREVEYRGKKAPCLIVDDLKLGEHEGAVALWVGPGTEGYFANLKVTPKRRSLRRLPVNAAGAGTRPRGSAGWGAS